MNKTNVIKALIENAPSEEMAIKMGYESVAQYLKVHSAFIDIVEAIHDTDNNIRTYLLIDILEKCVSVMVHSVIRNHDAEKQMKNKIELMKSIIRITAAIMDVTFEEAISYKKEDDENKIVVEEKKTIH